MTRRTPGPSDADPPPSAFEVRQALARIAESEHFRNAPQLIAFLSFVVEKALAGDSKGIKGYTIATEALGRPPDFDPQTDPIVRVEAGRLRKALEAYYANGGSRDPLRIEVPRGSYAPLFVRQSAAAPLASEQEVPVQDREPAPPSPAPVEEQTAVEPSPAAAEPAIRHNHSPPPRLAERLRPPLPWIAGGVLAVVAVLAALLAWGTAPRERTTASRSTRPGANEMAARADGRPVVTVAPLAAGGPASKLLSPKVLRGLVVDALARFDEVAVRDQGEGEPVPREGYELALQMRDGEDGPRVGVRLTQRPTGRVVWVRDLDPSRRADPLAPPELDLARQVATTLGQPYGVLFADLRRRPETSARVRCLVSAYDYWMNPTAAAHLSARTCLEEETAFAPAPSLEAGLALLALDEVRNGFNPRPESLDRALRSARRAVELGPESPRAHQALMAALFARGAVEEALRAGRRAFDLNPYDSDIMADLGARQIQLGRYADGAALIRRAAEANPTDPPWYDFFLFLAAYMQGDQAGARAAADRIVAESYALGYVARAAAAVEAGEEDEARQAVRRLVVVQPDYARDPRGVLARRRLPPEATVRLAAALARAGLTGDAAAR